MLELQQVQSEQRKSTSEGYSLAVADELFGKIAVENSLITVRQLDECLKIQRDLFQKTKIAPKLEEILLQRKYLNKGGVELILALREQKMSTSSHPPTRPTRHAACKPAVFGQLSLYNKFVAELLAAESPNAQKGPASKGVCKKPGNILTTKEHFTRARSKRALQVHVGGGRRAGTRLVKRRRLAGRVAVALGMLAVTACILVHVYPTVATRYPSNNPQAGEELVSLQRKEDNSPPPPTSLPIPYKSDKAPAVADTLQEEQLKERVNKIAAAEFQRRVAQAESLVAKSEFQAAMELFGNFPPDLDPGGKWVQFCFAKRNKLRQLGLRKWENYRSQISQLLESGDITQAKDVLDEAEKIDLWEIRNELDALRKQLAELAANTTNGVVISDEDSISAETFHVESVRRGQKIHIRVTGQCASLRNKDRMIIAFKRISGDTVDRGSLVETGLAESRNGRIDFDVTYPGEKFLPGFHVMEVISQKSDEVHARVLFLVDSLEVANRLYSANSKAVYELLLMVKDFDDQLKQNRGAVKQPDDMACNLDEKLRLMVPAVRQVQDQLNMGIHADSSSILLAHAFAFYAALRRPMPNVSEMPAELAEQQHIVMSIDPPMYSDSNIERVRQDFAREMRFLSFVEIKVILAHLCRLLEQDSNPECLRQLCTGVAALSERVHQLPETYPAVFSEGDVNSLCNIVKTFEKLVLPLREAIEGDKPFDRDTVLRSLHQFQEELDKEDKR